MRAVTCVRIVCLVLPAFFSTSRAEPVYTDQDLLRQGQTAYDANPSQCVKVVEFLFAYTLRNSPDYEQDRAHREDVNKALRYCESQLSMPRGAGGAEVRGKADVAQADKSRQVPEKPSINFQTANHPDSGDRKRCNIYAQIAVAQNQSNLSNRCSFSGGRWNASFAYHFRWCMTVTGEQSRGETKARQALLDRCAP